MMQSERDRARAARHGAHVCNQDGDRVMFLRLRGNAPTEEEQRSSVKWNTGTELTGSQVHQCHGPDLAKLIE